MYDIPGAWNGLDLVHPKEEAIRRKLNLRGVFKDATHSKNAIFSFVTFHFLLRDEFLISVLAKKFNLISFYF